MKKILTSFLLIIAVTSSGWAQFRLDTNTSNPKTLAPLVSNSSVLNYKTHSNTRYTGNQWYAYFGAIQSFLGTTQPVFTNTYLFPDTVIRAKFGTSVSSPFVHSIATILDPTSVVFHAPYAPAGSMAIGTYDSYTYDSVRFFYSYFRIDADTSIVDTLEFSAFTTSSMLFSYFTGPTILTDFDVDTVDFGTIAYDSIINNPVLKSPNVSIKIPLNNASLGDTLQGGGHLAQMSTSSLGTVPARGQGIIPSGGLVGAEAHFIPGYHYTGTDTLNNMNFIIISSLNEIPGASPIYNKDYNQSYIIEPTVRYNYNKNGFNGFYVPTDDFSPAYTYDDHEFEFLLGCASCFGVGVKNVNANSADVNVYPNPTSTNILARYFLTNTSDVTIEIKDLSGRTISTEVLHGQNSGLQQHSVDVSNFTSGVYFCSVITNDGVFTKKFIINK